MKRPYLNQYHREAIRAGVTCLVYEMHNLYVAIQPLRKKIIKYRSILILNSLEKIVNFIKITKGRGMFNL